MWMGCFHPPLPMHVFAEEPGLRAAPTAQGVGTDPKDLGCFGGGEPGFLGLSRHKQSIGVCSTYAADKDQIQPETYCVSQSKLCKKCYTNRLLIDGFNLVQLPQS